MTDTDNGNSSPSGANASATSIHPAIPFAFHTGITVIGAATPIELARAWRSEIENAYDRHFGGLYPMWTWDDIHCVDRDAMTELEEIIRAGTRPPIDIEVLSGFTDPLWRMRFDSRLKGFRVSIHEDRGDKFTTNFDCAAKDADDAADRALAAYPYGEVIQCMELEGSELQDSH